VRTRRIVVAVLLIGLVVAALPWLDVALYAMRLAGMPAPSTLPMPVANLKSRGLSDTWQAPRSPRRRHEGIDIFAKKGTPIISATEGIVLRRGQNSLGGNVVWVLGPAGHQHYYAHLDQFADLSTGDIVQVGTVLGYVGNTGNAKTTPPHLHYGIYTDAGAVNPYPLLATHPKHK
jgi:murein DD-endopeptidase MepM/ murein hydrolase activator NlpD